MKKSFKLVIVALLCFISETCVFAQQEVTYKEVLLNGKPAKLNTATGEITLVNLKEKKVKSKIDSVTTNPINIANTKVIGASNLPKVSTADTSDFHIVKEGDNLFKLSVTYHTSLVELKNANNLETTLIKKGQKLRVRNFDKANDLGAIWIVKKGDNLYRIAIENGTTVSAIKSLNGLTSDNIYIGQKLQLK